MTSLTFPAFDKERVVALLVESPVGHAPSGKLEVISKAVYPSGSHVAEIVWS